MTSLSNLKVFATHPHQCSYLAEEQATTLFIDPEATITHELYNALAEVGFRRSGPHIYRPHCQRCNACIPARVQVQQFAMKRRQRRIWNRNADLVVEQVADIQAPEYYALYSRYINERHYDGDMFPPSRDQYDGFLTNDLGITEYFAFRDGEKLVAVAVVDVMDTGLSAIYTFYDPLETKRSLGSYAILWQIERTRALGLPYLYLGYWIKECRKMQYKIDYRPLQLLINKKWLTLN